MSTQSTGEYRTSEDEKILHRLGYAQELLRAMGAFRNFAISFTIISILAGCLTSYYLAFQWGGPVAVEWGWIVVGVFTTFVALSMAEIASAFPTAGGLYYWSSKLGSAAWGWFTGWFNLIGLIGIIGAVGYGLAIYATAFFNLLWDYPNDRHHIFYLFAAFLVLATLVNVFDVRITSTINGISAYWHVIGVPDHRLCADHRPEPPSIVRVRLRPDREQFGVLRPRLEQRPLLDGVRDRLDRDGPVHAHRLRRLGPPGRGDAQGVTVGGGRNDLGRRRLGDRRLRPADRDHLRDPGSDGRAGAVHVHHHVHLADVDGHALGGGAPLHRRRGAVLLPDGVPDVRLADAVRVLPRSRSPRAPDVAHRLAPSRPGLVVLRSRRGGLPPAGARRGGTTSPATTSARRSGRPGSTSRSSCRSSCAIGSRRELRARGLEPGQALQVDQPDRDPLGRVHLGRLHAPDGPRRHPVEQRLELEPRQLRPGSRSAARSSCSAAGTCCRPASGSRARCAWAPTRSSNGSRPSRRRSSCSRPTRPTSPLDEAE